MWLGAIDGKGNCGYCTTTDPVVTLRSQEYRMVKQNRRLMKNCDKASGDNIQHIISAIQEVRAWAKNFGRKILLSSTLESGI